MIGIDPGTKCGYAFAFVDSRNRTLQYPTPDSIGVLDLSIGEYDSGAIRWLRLLAFLDVAKEAGLAAVGMEGRDFSAIASYRNPAVVTSGLKAVELLSSLKSHIALWCERHGIPCVAIPIGTIKRRATGKGNVGKEPVIAACNASFGTAYSEAEYAYTGDDNRADAAWVCAITLEDYGRAFFEGNQ